MKLRFLKTVGIVTLAIFAIVSIFPTTSFAVADASLSAGKTTLSVNETTQITASISGTEVYELKLSSSGGTLAGTTEDGDAYGEEKSASVLSATFSAPTAGTYTITLTGTVASSEDVTNNKVNNISKSITITVEAPVVDNQEPPAGGNEGEETGNESGGETTPQVPVETPTPAPQPEPEPKSTNNYLSSLTVSKGKLTPAFNRATVEYTLEFPEDFDYKSFETLTVSAKAEHNKAKVGGAGDITVKEGENVVEIDVMPEAGNPVRTYKITFVKPEIIEQSDLRLKTLTINTVDEDGKTGEAKIEPEFSPEVFNYTLSVDSKIEKLEVNGEVENDKIVVEIEGADKLHIGKNLVKITLKSPDDETIKSVYQITVNKEREELVETPLENTIDGATRTKIIMGIVIGIIIILAIVLVVLIIINNKKNKQERIGQEDDEDYDKFVKKETPEELEKKKQSLFNYDEEDTHLKDDKLAKLTNEYLETAKKIELEEKEKNEQFDKVAGEMEGKKYIEDDAEDMKEDIEAENENNEENDDKEDNETSESPEEFYEKNSAIREAKLEALTREIKEKRNEQTSKSKDEKPFNKDEFLNEIKNKRDKNL